MKIINILSENKGIVSMLGGVIIMAIGVTMIKKASAKADVIKEEHKATETIIEECVTKFVDEYTEQDRAKDIIINNAQTTVKYIKNYAMSYIVSMFGGYVILNSGIDVLKKRKLAYLNEKGFRQNIQVVY